MNKPPSQMTAPRKFALFIPGILAFLLYMRTMPSTLQVGDAGEQIAAAHVLGISHPTGTPLYLLLMKAWELLFPFGSVVFRMNLLNAILGAVTVGLFALMIYGFALSCRISTTRGLLLSTALALTLAYSRTFWYESVAASSYMLHALFVVLWLKVIVHIILKRQYRRVHLLYLLAGVSLANHILSLILVLSSWWFSASLLLRREISFRRFIFPQWGLVPGLCLYAYIPLRAVTDPQMNWGNPDSMSRFIHYIFRMDYFRQVYVSSFADFLEVGLFQVKSFMGEMSPLLPMLMLVILMYQAGRILGKKSREQREEVGAGEPAQPLRALIPGIVLAVFNMLALSLHGSHTDIFFWGRYMLTAYMGLFTSCALFLLWSSRANGARLLYLSIPAILAMPGVCLYAHFSANDRSHNTLVESFVDQVFSHLPAGTTLYAAGDNYLFPLLYYRLVEGKRPDLTLFNPEMGLGKKKEVASLIEKGRLYSTHYFGVDPPTRVVPFGLVFKFIQGGEDPPGLEVPWGDFSTEELAMARSPLEKTLVVDYYHRRSVYHEQRKEHRAQLHWIRKMGELAHGYDRTLMLTGRAYARVGRTSEAVKFLKEALEINPKNRAARAYLESIKGRSELAGPRRLP